MRTLLLPAVLAGLIAVPTAALAAPTLDVDSGPLDRRAAEREAHSQLREATARAKRKATPPAPKVSVPPHLQAIAECESGGDPSAIGGGGLYRGKYQFSYSTWASVGGHGDPAAAPEAEQDKRAALLYERSGPGQWPVCGS
jgi:Transglycosylase-like domain